MPATKRSRKSGARNPTKRGKNFKKPKIDNIATNGKDLALEEEEIVEQMTQVAKRPEANQTSERWTPYFKSKRLHSLSHGEDMQSAAADGDEEAREQTAAMQVRVQLFDNDFHTFCKIIAAERNPFGLCDLTRAGPLRNVNPFAAPSSRSSDLITNR